ncbi:hypothetical protein Pmani_010532 [Petrolisthes manimaculis]|uniref:SWIM-type domain-containing protein n=1 Tax=Petrolisthes manimaculis TaxID=1843537 RepID=A0AAE1Q2Y2_9EUCA|nr:hypothetical protein Pmani_010532 [Petrolisthes manimaculis]
MERYKKSICYMSLADAFLTRLRKEAEVRTRRRILKGVGVEVLPVTTMDRHDFIYEYLINLYKKKKGTFNKSKVFSKQTIYECERSNLCRGSSTGDPTKTRANGCNAYVSFMFEEGATITACVVRSRLTHNGHDPNNRDESRVSRIDPSLKVVIESQINGGVKITGIMSEIAKWNKLNKNTDHHNRRFFPTRQDIQQLALSMKKPLRSLSDMGPKKYDTGSKDHVSQLVRVELRDSCLYHQSRTTTGPNARPLIVVLQNRTMRETLTLHGQHLIFVDKNYEGLRQYGNAVYVLVARDEGGGGGPVAYIVTSDDSVVTFVQALQKLSARCQLSPRAFFLDREIHKFSEVMSTIFPESQFLTSWCSVMQDIHQWLLSSEVSGKNNADIRRVLMHFVLELRVHDTEGWFLLSTSEIQERIEYDKFTAMLQAEWLSCAAKWSDFGRLGVCGSQEVGAALEIFFQRLQHQYLKGIHTKKSLQDLLRLLTDNINNHNNIGRSVPQVMERTVREQAEELVREGRSQLLMTWQGDMVALVGSHNTHSQPQTHTHSSYRAALVTMECECPGPASEGPCLHLCLALAVAQSVEGRTPHQERHRLASEAYESCDYILDGTFCITFHCGGANMCVVELATGECTCLASTFGVECVGKILLKIANGIEEAVTYTVPTVTNTTNTDIISPTTVVELPSAIGSGGGHCVGSSIVVVESSTSSHSMRTDDGIESRLIENIAMETENIAIETENIAIETENIAIETENIAIDTKNIAVETENIVMETKNIAIETENIAMETVGMESSEVRSTGSVVVGGDGVEGVVVSCVPWTPDKATPHSITITLTEEEEEEEQEEEEEEEEEETKNNLTHYLRPLVVEEEEEKKIVDDTSIKKEFAYPTNTTTTTLSNNSTSTTSSNNKNINKSSQVLIEDLYRWSKSGEFVDSKELQILLRETHNLVFLTRQFSSLSSDDKQASSQSPSSNNIQASSDGQSKQSIHQSPSRDCIQASRNGSLSKQSISQSPSSESIQTSNRSPISSGRSIQAINQTSKQSFIQSTSISGSRNTQPIHPSLIIVNPNKRIINQSPCSVAREEKGRKTQVVGNNKNLRAVVVRRKKRRKGRREKEEEEEWERDEEEEEEEERCVLPPPTKLSRSGRAIRIKEEPDFVM